MAAETCALARQHLGITDEAAVQLTLCAAVNVHDNSDPLWPMLVGPASAGKTTILSLTQFLGAWVLDDPTVAGLLGWGKDGSKAGLLARLGPRGLVVIPDLSPILAGSDRGAKDALFGQLRRIYDGSTSRTHNQGNLEWEGRVVVVAACTSAIDSHHIYGGELGPRFVYLRMPDDDVVTKMALLKDRKARIRKLAEVQTAARRAVERAVFTIGTVEISERLTQAVNYAAMICSYGRTSVPRDSRHEVVGLAETEAPWRLVAQLEGIVRAGTALGMTVPEIEGLCFRVARDSMPLIRRRVLSALAESNGHAPSTAEVTKFTKGSVNVVKRCLEDLELSQLVRLEQQQVGAETKWFIRDDFRPLVSFVFKG